MAASPTTDLIDGFLAFEGGMDAGRSQFLLQKNQLAYARNCTLRGDFVKPRPPWVKVNITAPQSGSFFILDQPSLIPQGLFQGACYYMSDAGNGFLMAAIGGVLFKIDPINGTVTNVSKDANGNPLTNSASQTMAWLWQCENYVFWNNNHDLPIFYDGKKDYSTQSEPNPIQTKINEPSGWQRPDVGAGKYLTLVDTFTGTRNANINGNAYILYTHDPADVPKVSLLAEKMAGNDWIHGSGESLMVDPGYIGDTTEVVTVPAVSSITSTPAVVAATQDVLVHANYTPGIVSSSPIYGVPITSSYTPAHSSPSSQSLTSLGTSYNNAIAFPSSGSINGLTWHKTGYNIDPNNGTLFVVTAVFTNSTAAAITIDTSVSNVSFSIFTVAAATQIAASPSDAPGNYSKVPTTGTMVIGGESYNYTSLAWNINTTTGAVTGSVTLVNYNSVAHTQKTQGASIAFGSGGTVSALLGNITLPAQAAAAAANPDPALIKAAVPSSGSVTILGVTYSYTASVPSDVNGVITWTLTLGGTAGYNSVLRAGAPSNTAFTFGAYTFYTNAALPAIAATQVAGYVNDSTTAFHIDLVTGQPFPNAAVNQYITVGGIELYVVSVSQNQLTVKNIHSTQGNVIINPASVRYLNAPGNPSVIATFTNDWSPVAVGATELLQVNAVVDPANMAHTVFITGDPSSNISTWDKFVLQSIQSPLDNPNQMWAVNVNDDTYQTVNGLSVPTTYTDDNTVVKFGSPQFGAGRMGAYGMGRNWVVMGDGLSFVAGDMVGGSSGDPDNNGRDAVLNISENTYLNGGGSFRVPAAGSNINAMVFAATLDASLGQGPLQVLTGDTIFSCNAPADRTTWQNTTNPIVTQSLIGGGGLSQDSTVVVNGDIFFRDDIGVRSLILARRDFTTWGNVPISREVQPVLDADDQSLLGFCRAVNFDNRFLLSSHPVSGNGSLSPGNVYHDTLVAINFDPTSSMGNKSPSIWDGVWDAPNILKFVSGKFASVRRCFAFCLNNGVIELYELLPGSSPINKDNGTNRIQWSFETPVLFRNVQGKGQFECCRLIDGELYADLFDGPVDFKVQFRPDYDSNWHDWYSWTVPAPDANNPTYQTRMGLGEPPTDSDQATGQPYRDGQSFQLKITVTGYCRIMGAKFAANRIPQPKFAPQIRS